MDIRKDMKREIKGIHTDETWITDTLTKIEQDKKSQESSKGKTIRYHKKMGKRVFRIAMTAASIVVLSTGSVFAYNYTRAKRNNYEPVNTAKSLDHLSDAEENGVELEESGETVSNKEIQITCTSYKAEKHEVYIGLKVNTTDGSALFDEDENHVAMLMRSGFDNISVSIDGGEYVPYRVDGKTRKETLIKAGNEVTGTSCWIMDVGDENDPTMEQYEMTFSNYEMDLTGKKLAFRISGYESEIVTFNNNGFQDISVADLLQSGTVANENDFIPMEGAKDYEGAGWQLQPGQNKIALSDAYPDCYIDNYGFHSGNGYNKKQLFYMTVVCQSEESKAALRKLTFQNTITGYSERNEINELPDGRLQFVYNINSDAKFSRTNDGIYSDTTAEYLNTIKLKLIEKVSTDAKTIISTDNLEFTVDIPGEKAGVMTEIDTNPDVTVKSQYTQDTMVVSSLTLNSMELKISTSYEPSSDGRDVMKDFGMSGKSAPQIVMKNGTKVSAGQKLSGGGSVKTGKCNFSWILPSIINVADVSQITWHGTVIYQAQ